MNKSSNTANLTPRSSPTRGLACLALVAFTAFFALSACSAQSSGEIYNVVIPNGEWVSKSGRVLDPIPQRVSDDGTVILEFSVGDTLVVSNKDSVLHTVGLVATRPGETVSYTMNQKGVFEGACTLLTGDKVLIEVS